MHYKEQKVINKSLLSISCTFGREVQRFGILIFFRLFQLNVFPSMTVLEGVSSSALLSVAETVTHTYSTL